MAQDTITINKVLSIFRDLAIRHEMINDFGFGQTSDIGNERPMLFPYLWIEPSQTRITQGTTANRYQEILYSFNVYLMDKIQKGDDNWDETLSDTNYILTTIVREMSQHPYYVDMNVSLYGDIVYDPAIEAYDDNVNGWLAQFTLKIPLRYGFCETPIIPLSGWTSSLTPEITQYRLIGSQGPTGPQGPQGNIGPQGDRGFWGGWVLEFNGTEDVAPIDTYFVLNGGDLISPGEMYFSSFDAWGNDINSSNTVYSSIKEYINNNCEPGQMLFFKISDFYNEESFNMYKIKIDEFNIDTYSPNLFLNRPSYIGGSNLTTMPSKVVFSILMPGGKQGYQGYQGYQGDIGPQGLQGPQGLRGFQGFQGFQGPQGFQGQNGTIGVNGATGAQGFQGPQGFQGNQGYQGPQGFQGNQGYQGPQGLIGATGAGGALGYYGSFYDTTTQILTSATTSYVVGINTTAISNGISITSGNRVTFNFGGIYEIIYSLQYDYAGNSNSANVDVWIRKNGTDISDSNSTFWVPSKQGSIDGQNIATSPFIVSVNSGDYIQIVTSPSTTDMSIKTIGTQSSPITPETPSVIVTVKQIMYTQVGPTGSQGPTGPQGPQGNQGVTGPQGYQGPQGPITTLSIYGLSMTQSRYNDLAISGMTSSINDALIRFTASTIQNAVISGVAGGFDGRRLYLQNSTISSLIILEHQVTSLGSNQFFNPDATVMFVKPGETIQFTYNSYFSRWDLVGSKNYSNQFTTFDDMLYGGANGGLTSTAQQATGLFWFSNSGAATTIQNSDLSGTSGTSDTGGMSIITIGTASGNRGTLSTNRVFGGFNMVNGEFNIMGRWGAVPTQAGNINNGVDFFRIQQGFGDMRNASAGAYWMYDNSLYGITMSCITNNGSGGQTRTESYTVATYPQNTGIFIWRTTGANSTLSQACFYYSTDGQTYNIAASHTANLPISGFAPGAPGINISRTANGVNNITLYVDFLAYMWSGTKSAFR